jgi:hypothetical protein
MKAEVGLFEKRKMQGAQERITGKSESKYIMYMYVNIIIKPLKC